MTKWVDTTFGDLPVGALFRESPADTGLCIKVRRGEVVMGNSIIIVSDHPGDPNWCQAGEAGNYDNATPVQQLVL